MHLCPFACIALPSDDAHLAQKGRPRPTAMGASLFCDRAGVQCFDGSQPWVVTLTTDTHWNCRLYTCCEVCVLSPAFVRLKGPGWQMAAAVAASQKRG